VAVVLNLMFLIGAIAIFRRDEAMAEADGYKVEKRVFFFSIFHLFASFAALLLDALILGGFVLLVFVITVVKLSQGQMIEGFDHAVRPSLLEADK